jgi:hypothetical protein
MLAAIAKNANGEQAEKIGGKNKARAGNILLLLTT